MRAIVERRVSNNFLWYGGFFLIRTDVSRKLVDGSQGERQNGRPTKGNEVIGVAPV